MCSRGGCRGWLRGWFAGGSRRNPTIAPCNQRPLTHCVSLVIVRALRERESMGETAAGVEIRQLRKRFTGGDHDAVDGVDLSIRDGELLVLLGPSGCGKTTLLGILAELDPPTARRTSDAGRRV